MSAIIEVIRLYKRLREEAEARLLIEVGPASVTPAAVDLVVEQAIQDHAFGGNWELDRLMRLHEGTKADRRGCTCVKDGCTDTDARDLGDGWVLRTEMLT